MMENTYTTHIHVSTWNIIYNLTRLLSFLCNILVCTTTWFLMYFIRNVISRLRIITKIHRHQTQWCMLVCVIEYIHNIRNKSLREFEFCVLDSMHNPKFKNTSICKLLDCQCTPCMPSFNVITHSAVLQPQGCHIGKQFEIIHIRVLQIKPLTSI